MRNAEALTTIVLFQNIFSNPYKSIKKNIKHATKMSQVPLNIGAITLEPVCRILFKQSKQANHCGTTICGTTVVLITFLLATIFDSLVYQFNIQTESIRLHLFIKAWII